jgi:hypothetical protein
MFRSYDHLQVEIYLLGFTRLTADPLFLEYSKLYYYYESGKLKSNT